MGGDGVDLRTVDIEHVEIRQVEMERGEEYRWWNLHIHCSVTLSAQNMFAMKVAQIYSTSVSRRRRSW